MLSPELHQYFNDAFQALNIINCFGVTVKTYLWKTKVCKRIMSHYNNNLPDKKV